MHRIDGPGATVDNKFTEGDPVGGIQATVVTDDWLNDVQEEVMSVLSAGGVTPVKGTQDQLLQSLYKLLQVQKATAFTTAGTATTLTLKPSPEISAYAVPLRFNVKFHVNSGLNPTLNVSAKGAKNLKQYDASGAKVAAAFAADQVGDVFYDGTDFVLLDPLRGNSQATEAVLGSVKIATQTQVNTGADDTAAITPLKLATLRAASTIATTPVTMTAVGLVSLANPWGAAPSSIKLVLTCITSDLNYSPGDRVFCAFSGSGDGGSSSNSSPIAVFEDSTHSNVYARVGALPTNLTNKTTGVQSVITFARWQISLEITR
ncbi:hypothetical protein ACI77F_07340 [Pseudomonas tritici]|uniref:hypothetical protein n=1 Tax=Pseudomonas tritici TaxID=2745518 RepID=UPI00387B8AC2